jgi:hypothetical protein
LYGNYFCLDLQESGGEQVSDDEEKPVQPDDDRVQEVSDMQAESPSTRYGVGTVSRTGVHIWWETINKGLTI